MPTSKTIIAQPLVELDPKERKEKLSRFKTIKDKVSVVLNNKDEVQKIVDKYGSSENESAMDYEKNLKNEFLVPKSITKWYYTFPQDYISL